LTSLGPEIAKAFGASRMEKHNLTIYSQDAYGIKSDPRTIYFDVKVPEPSFPTASLIVAVSTATVIVGIRVGLQIFRKKHRN
jgi:hypothetical protein